MLETPIIVSDEEVYRGNFAINSKNEIIQIDSRHEYPYNKYGWRKIIAGIEGLPSIDWNGLEEEFGWVDAETILKKQYWDTSINLPFNQGYITGFKKALSLNEKKFSLEEARLIWFAGQNIGKLRGIL